MNYLFVKNIHVASVIITVCLFVIRSYWSWFKPILLSKRWVKILPHLNDTILLSSAIWLSLNLHQYPFVHHWLSSKVIVLCIYIISASISLKQRTNKSIRLTALIIAIGSVSFIITVALSKHPFGWLALLNL